MSLIVTVSEVVEHLAILLDSDRLIRNISVKGEISDFTDKGNIFFTLKEGDCSIKAVMFKSYAASLTFEPQKGMNVIANGSVRLYKRDGVFQIYVTELIQDEGIGDGLLSFEQLKNKLNSEGLFDRKRPIPSNPRTVCVVTSETGAAIQDIKNVISRRNPFVKLILVPVLVQGADAPASITAGIEKAQNTDSDVIIFGRGGGSSDDLSAFNAETVARAVFNSRIPTISAVGHEINRTIADFTADKYAPTPSAAAEIAVPDINEVRKYIVGTKSYLYGKLQDRLKSAEGELNSLKKLISLHDPSLRIEEECRSLKNTSSVLKREMLAVINAKNAQLGSAAELLNALDPMQTLLRGYSVVYNENGIVSSVKAVKAGEKITVKMSDGEFNAVVVEKEK